MPIPIRAATIPDVLASKPIAQERVDSGLGVKPVAENCKNGSVLP